jgi:hypothetical protein
VGQSWRRAGEELERRRAEALAGLGDAEAREITRELLSMWRPDDSARAESGLVEQQRVFHAWHRRHLGAGDSQASKPRERSLAKLDLGGRRRL